MLQDSAQLETQTGRRQPQADPNAFGASEARGAGAIAQGLGKVADVAVEIDDDFNEANARELDNELSRQVRDRLYNPETGYLSTQRGRNAIDARGQVEADIDALAVDLESRARNPRAAAMYRQVARNRLAGALGDVAQHATRETVNYQNEVSEARLNEFVDNAVAAYGDPAAVAAQMDGAVGEIGAVARRLGWDEQTRDNRIRRVQSDMMSRVIVQIAATDPNGAEELFARVRPSLSAQDAGELLTTMRAAQAQARERVSGAVWQTLANGGDPREIPEWQEFSRNPMFGREHETFNEYRRQRARAAAEARMRSNGPAFLAALGASYGAAEQRDQFTAPGALEAFLEEHGAEMSGADMVNLFQRREAIRNGDIGEDSQAITSLQSELMSVSRSALSNHINLNPSDANNDSARAERQRARAYEASLLRETQRWLREHDGQRPVGEEVQVVIGRAVVGMSADDVQDLPDFRVGGVSGRDDDVRVRNGPRRGQGVRVRASTEANVPYDVISVRIRDPLVASLRRRLGDMPTKGEVENAYAAFLSANPQTPEELEQVFDRIIVGGGE